MKKIYISYILTIISLIIIFLIMAMSINGINSIMKSIPLKFVLFQFVIIIQSASITNFLNNFSISGSVFKIFIYIFYNLFNILIMVFSFFNIFILSVMY